MLASLEMWVLLHRILRTWILFHCGLQLSVDPPLLIQSTLLKTRDKKSINPNKEKQHATRRGPYTTKIQARKTNRRSPFLPSARCNLCGALAQAASRRSPKQAAGWRFCAACTNTDIQANCGVDLSTNTYLPFVVVQDAHENTYFSSGRGMVMQLAVCAEWTTFKRVDNDKQQQRLVCGALTGNVFWFPTSGFLRSITLPVLQ